MIGDLEKSCQVPDFIEPIIGFREWIIEDNRLYSPYYEAAWEPGVMEAHCTTEHFTGTLPKVMELAREAEHGRENGKLMVHQVEKLWKEINSSKSDPVPSPNCTCGLYAFLKPKISGAFDYGFRGSKHKSGILVIGAVRMWGRVELHQTGLRAQYAEPFILAHSPFQGPLIKKTIKKTADDYHCRMVSVYHLEAQAKSVGKLLQGGDLND